MRKNASSTIIGYPPMGDFIRQPPGTVGYYRTPNLRKFQHAVGGTAIKVGGKVAFRTLYAVDPHDPDVKYIIEVTVVKQADRRKKRDPIPDLIPDPIKSKAGKARAASLTPERRSEIAKKAAKARWGSR